MGLIRDSTEHKAIRESVAGIASRYGVQYYTERGRSGGGIEELWKDLGAAGLLGLHLPEEYGGGGGGMADAVVVVEDLPHTACRFWSGSSLRRSAATSWPTTPPRK